MARCRQATLLKNKAHGIAVMIGKPICLYRRHKSHVPALTPWVCHCPILYHIILSSSAVQLPHPPQLIRQNLRIVDRQRELEETLQVYSGKVC